MLFISTRIIRNPSINQFCVSVIYLAASQLVHKLAGPQVISLLLCLLCHQLHNRLKQCIFGRRFLFPFRSNSRQDYRTVGKLQDPAAARLIFVIVAALGANGCCRKLSGIAPSMIGQWVYVFFRLGQPQLRNRQTILASLESTGPYQRNGASLVFMCCLVLEIQVHVLQKSIFL